MAKRYEVTFVIESSRADWLFDAGKFETRWKRIENAVRDASPGAKIEFVSAAAETSEETGATRRKPVRVRDYFEQRLGEKAWADWRRQQVAVTSRIGKDCVRAIDAAAVLVESLRSANGEDSGGEVQQVIEACSEACGGFILGTGSDD